MPVKDADADKKLMKSLAVNAELRQGRYFNLKRLVRYFESIDEYCDQVETKDGSLDSVLSWMKDSSSKQDQVGNTILKMGKVLGALEKRLTQIEDKQ